MKSIIKLSIILSLSSPLFASEANEDFSYQNKLNECKRLIKITIGGTNSTIRKTIFDRITTYFPDKNQMILKQSLENFLADSIKGGPCQKLLILNEKDNTDIIGFYNVSTVLELFKKHIYKKHI